MILNQIRSDQISPFDPERHRFISTLANKTRHELGHIYTQDIPGYIKHPHFNLQSSVSFSSALHSTIMYTHCRQNHHSHFRSAQQIYFFHCSCSLDSHLDSPDSCQLHLVASAQQDQLRHHPSAVSVVGVAHRPSQAAAVWASGYYWPRATP